MACHNEMRELEAARMPDADFNHDIDGTHEKRESSRPFVPVAWSLDYLPVVTFFRRPFAVMNEIHLPSSPWTEDVRILWFSVLNFV